MIKGILIKSGQEPKVVDVKKDYESIKALLGIDESPITCAYRYVEKTKVVIYLDDEGLLKSNPTSNAICLNAHELLVGNLFICGTDILGNIKSLDNGLINRIITNAFDKVKGDDYISNYRSTAGVIKVKFKGGDKVLRYEC